MTVQHVANDRRAEDLILDDLRPYRGSWVAIRDGHVVASAIDVVALREDPAVNTDDWYLLVPTEVAGTYLL